ncbi:MAG TPA: phosphopyruvate hydratase [Candidatus Magasanikbacteria bacterium]|nr:phosphopyruvate hydratase [Candidatus Magasanikbacteria bacterium]
MKIKKIIAREILDSRGNPTVETKVVLQNGVIGVAKVPSGASTGSREALELRDGGKRYGGKGVLKAVKNVNEKIAKTIIGMDVDKIQEIDAKMIKMDGTKNKEKLGANAILSVSMAVARAGAENAKMPLYKYLRKVFSIKENKFLLPVPTMNIINGGAHADSGLSIQEFMIIPQHKLMSERVRMGAEVFHSLKKILKTEKLATSVGDEGGFAPHLKNNEEALKTIVKAIISAGYKPGKDVFLGLDVAASEFFENGKYQFEKGKNITADAMIKIYEEWIKKYPLILVEDGLAEQDWQGWKILTAKTDEKLILVGDDIFVTNPEIFAEGIKQGIGNAVLIKVNQIGTLSETIETIKMAKAANYKINVSHRSGETSDTFIADLAVAVNADMIKTGSLSRSERVEKYNRLMEIEGELKNF